MNFTDRQLLIITYILNHPNGIIGKDIANHFDISLRTLQSEIEAINDLLPEEESILGLGKKGYSASNLSKDTKEYISNQLNTRVSIRMPINKVSIILCVLMFQKDYISMEKLADIMYVSKATVFNEFKSSYMLKKCVQISKTKGLLAIDSEVVKRDELSKMFDEREIRLFDEELANEAKQLEKALEQILPNVFLNSDYSISGAALLRFTRYLMITAIRSKRGFLLEKEMHIEHLEVIDHIVSIIQSLIDVKLTNADIDQINIKFLELNTYNIGYKKELEDKLDVFKSTLKEKYGIDWNLNEIDQQRFLTHVEKLEIRSKYDHYNYNVLKRSINGEYPMSCHLILECFSDIFNIQIPDTEIPLLALYLGKYIEKGYGYPDCYIVTDLDPSITYYLKDMLQKELEGSIGKIEIVPDYIFKRNANIVNEQLFITTKESISIQYKDAILVHPLIRKDEINYIHKRLNRLLEARNISFFNDSKHKYIKQMVNVEKQYSSLDGFLKEYEIIKPSWYEFVLDVPCILFPSISTSKNVITVYSLQHSITYRGHSLKSVIVSNYDINSHEMAYFYETIRLLIDKSK